VKRRAKSAVTATVQGEELENNGEGGMQISPSIGVGRRELASHYSCLCDFLHNKHTLSLSRLALFPAICVYSRLERSFELTQSCRVAWRSHDPAFEVHFDFSYPPLLVGAFECGVWRKMEKVIET
jgi:hypothetical protein